MEAGFDIETGTETTEKAVHSFAVNRSIQWRALALHNKKQGELKLSLNTFIQ